jgi:hypothetical protein
MRAACAVGVGLRYGRWTASSAKQSAAALWGVSGSGRGWSGDLRGFAAEERHGDGEILFEK